MCSKDYPTLPFLPVQEQFLLTIQILLSMHILFNSFLCSRNCPGQPPGLLCFSTQGVNWHIAPLHWSQPCRGCQGKPWLHWEPLAIQHMERTSTNWAVALWQEIRLSNLSQTSPLSPLYRDKVGSSSLSRYAQQHSLCIRSPCTCQPHHSYDYRKNFNFLLISHF